MWQVGWPPHPGKSLCTASGDSVLQHCWVLESGLCCTAALLHVAGGRATRPRQMVPEQPSGSLRWRASLLVQLPRALRQWGWALLWDLSLVLAL